MKYFAIALMCILAGFLMGGWVPNADLKEARTELDFVRKQLKRQVKHRQSALLGVRQILDIPDGSEVMKPPPVASKKDPDAEVDPSETNAVSAEVEEAVTNRRPRRGPPWRRDMLEAREQGKSFEEQIELAVDAWSVRSELARDSFISNADLTGDEETRFNVLVEAMNLRIGKSIENWAARISDENLRGEEAGVRIMKDITEAIVLTYDEMDRSMPDGWRASTGEDFNLSNLIDPRVALPLAGLEGKLDFR